MSVMRGKDQLRIRVSGRFGGIRGVAICTVVGVIVLGVSFSSKFIVGQVGIFGEAAVNSVTQPDDVETLSQSQPAQENTQSEREPQVDDLKRARGTIADNLDRLPAEVKDLVEINPETLEKDRWPLKAKRRLSAEELGKVEEEIGKFLEDIALKQVLGVGALPKVAIENARGDVAQSQPAQENTQPEREPQVDDLKRARGTIADNLDRLPAEVKDLVDISPETLEKDRWSLKAKRRLSAEELGKVEEEIGKFLEDIALKQVLGVGALPKVAIENARGDVAQSQPAQENTQPEREPQVDDLKRARGTIADNLDRLPAEVKDLVEINPETLEKDRWSLKAKRRLSAEELGKVEEEIGKFLEDIALKQVLGVGALPKVAIENARGDVAQSQPAQENTQPEREPQVDDLKRARAKIAESLDRLPAEVKDLVEINPETLQKDRWPLKAKRRLSAEELGKVEQEIGKFLEDIALKQVLGVGALPKVAIENVGGDVAQSQPAQENTQPEREPQVDDVKRARAKVAESLDRLPAEVKDLVDINPETLQKDRWPLKAKRRLSAEELRKVEEEIRKFLEGLAILQILGVESLPKVEIENVSLLSQLEQCLNLPENRELRDRVVANLDWDNKKLDENGKTLSVKALKPMMDSAAAQLRHDLENLIAGCCKEPGFSVVIDYVPPGGRESNAPPEERSPDAGGSEGPRVPRENYVLVDNVPRRSGLLRRFICCRLPVIRERLVNIFRPRGFLRRWSFSRRLSSCDFQHVEKPQTQTDFSASNSAVGVAKVTSGDSLVEQTTNVHPKKGSADLAESLNPTCRSVFSLEILEEIREEVDDYSRLVNLHSSSWFVSTSNISPSLITDVRELALHTGSHRVNMEADELFGSAYHAFWQGKYTEAYELLAQGIRFNASDPRLWYYKGFCETALDRKSEAKISLMTALVLHHQGQFPSKKVAACLQRVQGRYRAELETLRPHVCRLVETLASENTSLDNSHFAWQTSLSGDIVSR
jgi:hypothetical protein